MCRVVAFFPNVLEMLTVLGNMLSGPFVSGNFPQPKAVNRWKEEMNIDERVGTSDGETAGAVGANAFCMRSMTVVRGVCTRRDPELPKGSSVSFGFFFSCVTSSSS